MFIVTLVFESFTKGILNTYNKNSNVLFMIRKLYSLGTFLYKALIQEVLIQG